MISLFTYAIVLGGPLLYQLVRQSYRYDWWIGGIFVASALFTHIGMYLPLFPRGSGYITPNRVIGLLVYLLIYGSILFAAVLRNHAETLRYNDDFWRRQKDISD